MPDPVATLGVGALAAYLGKDGLQKLLGPTADYLGAELKDLAQKRVEAIGRIFVSAQKKLGKKSVTQGSVPPKVLESVINQGSYSTEILAVEYFGGILASSRTETGRDDRGARLAKAVDTLSTYQLRAHYLIYTTVRSLFANKGISFNMLGRPKMKIFIPFEVFVSAMELNKVEQSQIEQLLNHTFFGLHADGFIEDMWQYGPKEHMVTVWTKAECGGIICQPSAIGAELFLSAFGHADKNLEYLFSSDLSVEVDGVPVGFVGAAGTEI